VRAHGGFRCRVPLFCGVAGAVSRYAEKGENRWKTRYLPLLGNYSGHSEKHNM
jgi:hypothetical protein